MVPALWHLTEGVGMARHFWWCSEPHSTRPQLLWRGAAHEAVSGQYGEDESSGLKASCGGPGEATRMTEYGNGLGRRSLDGTAAAWKRVAILLPGCLEHEGQVCLCIRSPPGRTRVSRTAPVLGTEPLPQGLDHPARCQPCSPAALGVGVHSRDQNERTRVVQWGWLHPHGCGKGSWGEDCARVLRERSSWGEAARAVCVSTDQPGASCLLAALQGEANHRIPGNTDHLDFRSEALIGLGRAWTDASAVPLSGLLGIRVSAGGLFSTGVSPAPTFRQAGGLQSQVTQSASPSADTSGDGSPGARHPAPAPCPQNSPRPSSCSSRAPSWALQPPGS